ncbi:glycosyltransferase [Leucobacter chinensis]|uniref:glycosyltransferase n=1 Tax=Leucobacter chinensis TaxID=2851010 RepID=UPI001C238081|nr:glycosyltransferase [Leucobacter chinensis]
MRIGLVSLHTSPLETPGEGDAGGLNVVVREAALALEALGHEVTIATRASLRQPAGTFPLSGDSRVTVVALEVGDPDLEKEALPAHTREFGRALTAHPLLAKVDVLHAHYWLSGIAALEAGHAPVVTTLHTVGAQKNAHRAAADAPEPDARLNAERRLVAETALVAGSKSELTAITEAYGSPGGAPITSRIIHPGVDTRLFAPESQTPPEPHQQPGQGAGTVAAATRDTDTEPRPRGEAARGAAFLVIGRVQPLKGQDLAVEAFIAFTQLAPGLAQGARLTIAGQATPGQESFLAALQERASVAGLDIQFLPAQSREGAARLMRESTVTLIPSHSETFGLVALESAASGTPVIAAHTTGLVESVREGVSGVLVSGRDALHWAQAMAHTVHDTAALDALGRSARAYAQRHDWHAHAQSLEAYFTEIVSVQRKRNV